MKKTSIILFLAIAVSSVTFFACNKQPASPENENEATHANPFQRKTLELFRGKISSTTGVTMSVDVVGNETVVITTASPVQSTDKYSFFTPLNDVSINAGQVTLTANGTKWWLVPFDPNKNPIEIIAGGGASAKLICYCDSYGTCDDNGCQLYTVNGVTTCQRTPNSCCEDCDMMQCDTRTTSSSPWTSEVGVSYRLINTNALRYNGTLYQ